jgi:hypothetical protein
MTKDCDDIDVLVQVLPTTAGGTQIKMGAEEIAVRLSDKADEVARAMAVGAKSVAGGLPGLAGAEGWSADEVSVKFAIAVTAEAKVWIITSASAAATFEVSITFRRRTDS